MRTSLHLVVRVFLLVACLPAAALAQRYLPTLEFKTIQTPNFLIHFHQGEEGLAARLSVIAEQVRQELLPAQGGRGPGRTHVILSGQDDLPNGWASTSPFNLIEIRTTWPRAASVIGNTDDWLVLVFRHEYGHILHLDRSNGLFRAARWVFGRVPFAMPNLFLPGWQVEGVATWRESTAFGRVRDGQVRRTLDLASASGRFEPLDRVSGGLVSWPDGDGAYFYGGLFHDYLARRFGAEAIERWSQATARWPPYAGMFAFRGVFGQSLSQTWREFEASWRPSPSSTASADIAVRRLTARGFAASAPRWDPARPGVLYFASRTPHEFPSLVELDVASGVERPVAEKFLGESVAVTADRILFDQLDLEANAALSGDLYLLDRRRNARRRVTTRQRIGDADLAPDGERFVASVTAADRRTLVVGDIREGSSSPVRLLADAPGEYFSGARWSPDGRRVVAERTRVGAPAEVVVVDAASGAVTPIAPGVGTRQATPTWTPDGRAILFAAATETEPFELVAVTVDDQRAWRVLAPPGGARSPDVSRDGRSVAFVGYTVDGEDIFVAALDPARWSPWTTPRGPVAVTSTVSIDRPLPAASTYSPLHGFVPRWWSPLVRTGDDGVAAGGMTSATDALGRHAYDASVVVWSDTQRAEWDVSYVYRRYKPILFAAGSGESRSSVEGLFSATTWTAGVAVPFQTVRRGQQVLVAARRERLTLETPTTQTASLDLNALRVGWALGSSNEFGYSVSPEEGVDIGLVSELIRQGFGASGNAQALMAEARSYHRVVGQHTVLAARVAGAVSSGDQAVQRQFSIDDVGPADGLLSVAGDAVALFRGAGAARTRGPRAATVNLDLRFPLWRLERGLGVYPAFLKWVHASTFVDAADAWDLGDRVDPAIAAGVEVSADLAIGYGLPVTVTTGVSLRVDRHRDEAPRPHVFLRLGRAF